MDKPLDSIDLETGRKPTSATSEAKVNIAAGSMPWQTESSKGDSAREHFKYRMSRTPSIQVKIYIRWTLGIEAL
jgi:hypothetical protein